MSPLCHSNHEIIVASKNGLRVSVIVNLLSAWEAVNAGSLVVWPFWFLIRMVGVAVRWKITEAVKKMPEGVSHRQAYRPDHSGGAHQVAFRSNRKIIFATQEYCALCGKPVDFSLKFPDPMSPTVDHIVPIAKGGHPSALENLQLAHLSCNRRKGQNFAVRQAPKPAKSNRSLPLSADWTVY